MPDLPPPSLPPADPQRELRLAHQRLASHVENTPLVVIEWDENLRVSRWNARAERVFGWPADEVLGKGLFDWPFVAPENRALAERMHADALAGRLPRTVLTLENFTKAGARVWCEWHVSVLYDAAGRTASVLSLGLDVTAQRTAAEELAVSEARVRAALDGAKMLAWDLDLVTNRWRTTADLPSFYGLPRGPDYSDPETALAAVHPDDLPVVRAGRRRAVETGGPMRYEFRGSAPGPDGAPRWFATRGQVLRDAAGRPARIVAVTTDVTDRRRADAERERLDRQLQDAQRWESLGVLAGGVAHDFNNILTVVLGSAALARRGVPPGSAALNYLDQIEQASRRAADVCKQMLAYTGRTSGAVGPVDLPGLVRESAPLLEIPAGHAPVRFDLGDALPPVQADPAQVRQVLVALVTNAGEATGGTGGEIVVRAAEAEVVGGPPDAAFRLQPPPGRYVVLTVSDTGPGMTPDVRARMFDPFFTTKFTGRGLGLAAVQGIVRAHKGGIRVETETGRGTTVCVYWPVAAVSGARREARRPAALVIDDEMFVREVTASTLEEMGFAPLLAADGPSGVELFRRHADDVKVAVVDVVMPGMTGDQALDALRLLAPALPCVLVSGLADRRAVCPPGGNTEFVQKPFHPEELMTAVRRVTGWSEKG